MVDLLFFVVLVKSTLLVGSDGLSVVVDVDSTVFAPFLAHGLSILN